MQTNTVPKRIVMLGTGGTIAGRATSAADNIGYTAGQVGISELVTGIAVPAGMSLLAEQVAQIDSKDMSFDIWRAMALRCAHWLAQDDVAGIVVTHGTDTLEETAYFLQRVLAPAKPVVLTCAMRPATAFFPDGPQNLTDALTVAATAGASGVMVVCAGVVHSALDVRKTHTYRLDAFSSGDAGALGYVEEGVFRQVRACPESDVVDAERAFAAIASQTPIWPRVEIVTSHAGARGALVDAMVQGGLVDGIVLAATGNGTVHHDLQGAALRAQEAGVSVLRATRCTDGRILSQKDAALRDAGGLSPVKARIALLLELMSGPRPE